MAWLRFTADIDWPANGSGKSWHTAYKAGMRCNVPSGFAKGLLASGAAVAIKTPPRAAADALKADPFWTPPASGSGSLGDPAEREAKIP